MKLHLPKSLRTALFAAFASVVAFSSSAYAGWSADSKTNGYAYYYDSADNATSTLDVLKLVTSGEGVGNSHLVKKGYQDLFICSGYAGDNKPNGYTGQSTTIGKIIAEDGVTLSITANPWQNWKTYTALVIEELEYGGGNGSGSFNVNSTADHVYLKRVSGTLSSVTNAGTLTLGALTLSGNVSNSGTLILKAVTVNNGTINNANTLKLAGTFGGSASIVGTGRVVLDTTGNLVYFDGMSYKYANSDAENNIKVGFITGEQTFRVLGEGVSSECVIYDNNGNVLTLNDGKYTLGFGNSTTFYIGAEWTYDSDQSSGASLFMISIDGVLNLPGNATSIGNMNIESDGLVKLTGDTKLSGELVITGGSFSNEDYTISKQDNTPAKLVLNNVGSATLSGNANSIDVDIEVGKGTTLSLTSGDVLNWSHANTLTVLTGGVVEFRQRQSLAPEFVINLKGGTLTGNGSGIEDANGVIGGTYGVDFYGGGTIKVTADSIITTPVGGHKPNGGTIKFDVAEDVTLTMTGNLVGGNYFSKDGKGTMIYSGAAITKKLTIEEGTFVHNGAGADTATIEVNKDGTLVLGQASNLDTLTNANITGSGTVLVHFKKGGNNNHNKYVELSGFDGTVKVNGWMDLTKFKLKEGAVIQLASGQHWSKGGTINYDILLSDVQGAYEFRGTETLTIAGKVTGDYLDIGTSNGSGPITLTHSGNNIKNVRLGEGITLTLGDGVNESIHNLSTITTLGNGATLTLNKYATLNAFTKGADSGTITLTGSGVYDLGSQNAINVSGLTDSQHWTGTVVKQGVTSGGLGLNDIGNVNSYVELINVTGWFTGDLKSNLILSKDENNPNSAAWTVNNGNSADGDPDTNMATFLGSVSGNGTLKFVGWSDSGIYTGFTFSGDLSGWYGVFEQASSENCFNLTLNGQANTINAEIKNSTSTGELHLRVQNMNNNAVATFNKDVTVSKLTLSQSATFNANLNVSGNASVANGNTLNMGQQVSDSDAGDGAAAVSEVYLSVRGADSSAADMTAVSMSKTQIAAVEGKEASISNSLIELKKATSYTIKDIAMSNVQLQAVTNAMVNMENVSGDMVLSGGTYAFNAVVKPEQTLTTTDNTTLNYQVEGTPQITLGTAGTQVVLTTDPRLDCGQVLGVYDLVFNVNLTLGENYTIDGELDWAKVVSFGGPLAELLAEQDAVYLTGTEALMALNNPYVTYDYTIVDGLATLKSVTIHGITAPEPTTATLSLLALATLAARRRRK